MAGRATPRAAGRRGGRAGARDGGERRRRVTIRCHCRI
jgi:hypothetical protein